MRERPSTPGESTTTTSDRIDHWAENRLPCSLRRQPDILTFPHRGRLTFWCTVTAVCNAASQRAFVISVYICLSPHMIDSPLVEATSISGTTDIAVSLIIGDGRQSHSLVDHELTAKCAVNATLTLDSSALLCVYGHSSVGQKERRRTNANGPYGTPVSQNSRSLDDSSRCITNGRTSP